MKETQLKETQLEINTKQTLMAQQKADKEAAATVEAQQATLNAQATRLVQGGGITTQPAAGAEQDEQATQTARQTALAATYIPKPSVTVDMEARMDSAKILLFEDMANRLNTNRYIKDTLDQMGMPYVDVGSAKGWLETEIASGGPDGKGWDLVIIAAEDKSGGIGGEFFDYVLDALNEGASVIFEVFYINKIYGGAAFDLLARCGIEYQGDMIKIPPTRMVMFPLDSTHPILQEPNAGLTFTDTKGYWWDDKEGPEESYDTGDLVKKAMGGDANLLIGTVADEKKSHGTVTVCMDDRLILQTFSTHNLTFNAMQPLLENYIHYGLKTRFQSSQ